MEKRDMNESTNLAPPSVSPEEIERCIEEYRRGGWECRAPAQVVYHDSDQPCPWPGCIAHIAGINFQLEKMGDRACANRLLSAWWQGSGLIGKCPECGRHVLFGLREKQRIPDATLFEDSLLPDTWHQVAYIVTKSKS